VGVLQVGTRIRPRGDSFISGLSVVVKGQHHNDK
jgi:hypothetical protein